MGQWQEFLDFLKEYNVATMAIAFMMGVVSQDLVQSLVDNIIMPFVDPVLGEGGWEAATLAIGPVQVKWGAFLASLLNFAIIAAVVFLIAKKLLDKEDLNEL